MGKVGIPYDQHHAMLS